MFYTLKGERIQVLPEQIQTVNPIFLLTMIPVFTYFILSGFLRKQASKLPRSAGSGRVSSLTALSFVVIALIQQRIDAGASPSIWWQILAYFILSAGEVLVSITGLEYAYTHSPKAMKSTMSAIWLLTVAIGNVFVGIVNNSIASGGFFAQLEGALYFWFFVGLMTITVLIFFMVSGRIRERSYIVSDVEGD